MPVRSSAAATEVDQVVVRELARRDVDADDERLVVAALGLPALREPARLVEHPGPDRDDQPGLLGERDEVGRGRRGRAPGAPSAPAPRGRRWRRSRPTPRAGSRRGTPRARSRRAGRARCAGGSSARWRVTSSNSMRRPPPASLARYIAASASRISSSTSWSGSAESAMPMLAADIVSPCARWNGRPKMRSTRSATAIASCSSLMSSHRIANSSPPKRATVSWRRSEWRRRSATATISLSPAGWPRLSLMTLKRSRSRKSTAT